MCKTIVPVNLGECGQNIYMHALRSRLGHRPLLVLLLANLIPFFRHLCRKRDNLAGQNTSETAIVERE